MIKFEKIPASTLDKIPDIQQILSADDKIIFAYLFGSLVTGKIKPLSDIDLAVYLKNTDNAAEYKLNLFCVLSDILGTSELDLVILNLSPVSLTGRILQNRRIIVDKEPYKRHLFESLSLRMFSDFRIKEKFILKRRYGIG